MNYNNTPITQAELAALGDAVSTRSSSALASAGARKLLTQIASNAEQLDLDASAVAECFADAYPKLSASGIYYRLQHYVLAVGGPVLGTALTAIGIGASIYLIKKGAEAAWSKISTGVGAIATFATAAVPGATTLVSAWKKWFGPKAAVKNDEVRDENGDVGFNPEYFVMGLNAVLPGPVPFLISNVVDVFADDEPLAQKVKKNAQPASELPAAAPVAQTKAPSLASTVTNAGIALGGKILGGMFSSFFDEVRDEEVRDGLTDDVNRFATYINAKYGIAASDESEHSGAPSGLQS